jgi:3'-5' exoribonuclease
MKSPYINELAANQVVQGCFLVRAKEVRQKKTGEPYLSLSLGDKSGDVDAKMWDNVAEVLDTFERDDFVRVKGVLQVYQNRPQFTVHKLQRLSDDEVDKSDFFPASKRDIDEMFAELMEIVRGMGNPQLKALLEAVFADPDIARRYRTAPAAKMVHHAWLGGLLEHVLSLCELCRRVAPHYAAIDLDLLLTGAILHDLGKIEELNYERSFSYSNQGQLLGHIVIGLQMIGEKLRGLPDFPPRLRTLVEHMILSHHGELEFGSPKVPLFAEALLLHHLDNLDSKMECVRGLIEQDRQVEGVWTPFINSLDRPLLKKSKYLVDEAPARGETPQPAAPPQPTAPATFEQLQLSVNSRRNH